MKINQNIWMLGNFPLEDHLAAIGDRLKGYKKSEVPFVNKAAIPWNGPKHVNTTCALDPSKSNSTLHASDLSNKLFSEPYG